MRELELIYAGVHPRKAGELEAFRERTALYSEVCKKLVYRTWSLGEGEDAVVFLPGGMAHGEVWFPQMLELRDKRRSIAFSLPEAKSLDEVAQGIFFTLERMGVKKTVLVGYSLGGLIAQVMMRLHPERVAGALLCLTGAPTPGLPEQVAARWRNRRAQAIQMRFANFNNAMRMGMAENVFKSNCPPGMEADMDFWRAFIEDSYCNHIYLKQYVNLNYIAQPELYKRLPFLPGDMKDWSGNVSILYSEQDKLYSGETPFLYELYPDAKRVDLGPEGQFSMLIHGGKVTQEVNELAEKCFPSGKHYLEE